MIKTPSEAPERNLKILSFHLWGAGQYDYSEGYFYTVADKPPTTPQLRYMSSGKHMFMGNLQDCITRMKIDIDRLSTESIYSNETVIPTSLCINEYNTTDNDHYYRYSGPPENEAIAEYSLKDGKLSFVRGNNLLGIF